MLGITPTYQEIKDFVVEQNLSNKCTFDQPRQLKSFMQITTPEGLDLQNSYRITKPCAKFFVEFMPVEDMFVLRCAYFDESMNPITREVFSETYPPTNSAVSYFDQHVVYWIRVPGTNTYNLSTSTESKIGEFYYVRIPIITKVS